MKLITKAIARRLPALYAQDGKGEEAIAYLKLFDPCGRYTLYVTEYDPAEGRLFGFCISALGPDCDEWGYSLLAELAAVKGRWGLGIERDMHFDPTAVGVCKKWHQPEGVTT